MTTFALATLLIIKGIISDSNEILSPRTLFLVGMLLVLGLPLLASDLAGEPVDPTVANIQTWASLGLLSFEAGSMCVRRRRNEAPWQLARKRVDSQRLVWTALALSAIGAAMLGRFAVAYELSPLEYVASLRSLPTDDSAFVSEVGRYIGWITEWGTVAGVLGMFLAMGERVRGIKLTVAWGLVLGGIPAVIQGGGRYPILMYLCILGSIWYLWRKPTRGHLPEYLVVVVLVAAAVGGITAVGATRFQGGLMEADWRDIHLLDWAQISIAADMLNSTVHAFDTFPDQQPHLMGSSFWVLLVTWIPRAWWPSKPVSIGTLLPSLRGEHGYSEAVSAIGELYANFGYPGIIGGMFLYGWFCNWLYVRFKNQKSNPLFVLPYLYCLPFFAMAVRGEFVTVWAHYLSNASALWLALRICQAPTTGRDLRVKPPGTAVAN